MTTSATLLIDFTRDNYFIHKDLKPRTREDYLTQIQSFDAAFQARLLQNGETVRKATIADLNDDNLAFAMHWKRQEYPATTCNKLRRTVLAVWNQAQKLNLTDRICRVDKYGEPKKAPSCWSVAEMELIVAAAERLPGRIGAVSAADFMHAWFSFIYATGARLNVTLNLPTANFDPVRGEVLLPHQHQKQAADQYHKIHAQAVEAVLRLRSAERGLPLLFGDWTMCKRALNDRIRDVLVLAGVRANRQAATSKDLTHKLRKTFGTHVTARADIETARVLLGHASTTTTQAYVDPRYVDMPNARDILPELKPAGRTLRIHRPEAG